MQGCREYLCTTTNINFLICPQCNKNTPSQDWMKQNFNPSDGKRNLTVMILRLGGDNVIINAIQVEHGQPGTNQIDGISGRL